MVVECVLQGERSLLMQFSMRVTGFLVSLLGNKGPEGLLIIQDLGGIEPKLAAVCPSSKPSELIRGK